MCRIIANRAGLFIIRNMPDLKSRADEPGDVRWLLVLGGRLRDARRALRVSTTSAAEAADVSRTTWHRMEAGSPSVSAGAYARALEALGIAGVEDVASPSVRPVGTIPTRIRIGDWPELAALAWSLQPDTLLSPSEALAVYERNSRHLDLTKLTESERTLLEDLREGLADVAHP